MNMHVTDLVAKIPIDSFLMLFSHMKFFYLLGLVTTMHCAHYQILKTRSGTKEHNTLSRFSDTDILVTGLVKTGIVLQFHNWLLAQARSTAPPLFPWNPDHTLLHIWGWKTVLTVTSTGLAGFLAVEHWDSFSNVISTTEIFCTICLYKVEAVVFPRWWHCLL